MTRFFLLVILLFCHTVYCIGQCISTGAHVSSATGASLFLNTSNVTANDDINATFSITANSGALPTFPSPMPYLTISDFGFTIPATASICGVVVNLDARTTFLSSGGPPGPITPRPGGYNFYFSNGGQKTNSTIWGMAYTPVVGSSSDLWGTTWNPTDVNSPSFSLRFGLMSMNLTAYGTLTALIDHITVTIYYDNNPLQLEENQNSSLHENPTSEKTITFYPNPAKSFATFYTTKEQGNLTIIDGFGKKLTSINISADQNQYSTPNLPAGIYQAILQTPTGFIHEKFIITE